MESSGKLDSYGECCQLSISGPYVFRLDSNNLQLSCHQNEFSTIIVINLDFTIPHFCSFKRGHLYGYAQYMQHVFLSFLLLILPSFF